MNDCSSTAVKKVEEDSLRLIGCGEEILDRLIAKDGEIPVLVYNSHPYIVEDDFTVEFRLAENYPTV